MKKTFLILCIVLSILSITAIDKTLILKPTHDIYNTRSTEGLISEYTYSEYLDNQWEDIYNSIYTYNVNNVTSIDVDKNIEEIWTDFEYYTYTYDTNNNLTNMLYQIYIPTLYNYRQENYSYNDDNLVESYNLQKWVNTAWQDSLTINYTYEDGILVDEEWVYFSSGKDNEQYRVSYEYNLLGYKIYELWEVSNDGVNWDNYSKCNYERDINSYLINEIWQTWSNESWQDYSKYVYSYNDAMILNNVTGLTAENNEWINYSLASYQYSDYIYADLLITQLWSNDTSNWENSTKYSYEYIPVVSNHEQNIENALPSITSYPNPSRNSFTVKSNESIISVSVYNLKGQKISEFSNPSKSASLELSSLLKESLPSGIYFLRVELPKSKFVTSKQVILK